MAEVREVAVPDLGDFADVEVIEIHISAGDVLEVEAPLVTLESDKATMDVPAPFAGRVESVAVGVGDRVSEGSVLCTMAVEASEPATAPEPEPEPEPAAAAAPEPAGGGTA